MERRNFLKGISLLAGTAAVSSANAQPRVDNNGDDTRRFWIETLSRIAGPVLEALSKDQLRASMPVEAHKGMTEDRKQVTYLEAFGRTMCGLAPFLERDTGSKWEQDQRKKLASLSVNSIRNAFDPSSNDFMNFIKGRQPLVDAAFFAHAMLRAPKAIWETASEKTKQHIVDNLRSTRSIQPYYSNWLLFTAMVEAALLKFTGDYDQVRIDYALREHENWYKGDGVYGDGPDFHFDYYNSYVIQPMLLDIAQVLKDKSPEFVPLHEKVLRRARRYAEIQERLISPDGAFPPVGRSLAYRCGAFQLLAQLALQKTLPGSLPPAQVRSALTAVIRRTLEPANTFDANGWLKIGLAGHQPAIGESYISTGSLYLCTAAFLPLGLSDSDPFWKEKPMEWTSVKAFSGKDFPIDKAL